MSFNTKDLLQESLLSLQAEPIPLQVFVVDNASKDGTQEMLEEKFGGWSSLKILCNDENLGFTRASNQPIPICRGRYILFLNPDTIIKPGALAAIAAYLDDHEEVGVVGPKLVDNNGLLHVSCGESWGLFYVILWRFLPYRVARSLFVRYRQAIWAKQGVRHMQWVSGACLMIRRKLALEIGGFDESFFLGAEDAVDLCLRVRHKGCRVVYYPNAEIIHIGGQSAKAVKPLSLLLAYQGHLYFQRKYHGIVAAMILKGALFLASLAKVMGTCLFGWVNPTRYRSVLKAHLFVALRILTLRIPKKEQNEKRTHAKAS